MTALLLGLGLALRTSPVQRDAELGNLVTAGALISLFTNNSHKE